MAEHIREIEAKIRRAAAKYQQSYDPVERARGRCMIQVLIPLYRWMFAEGQAKSANPEAMGSAMTFVMANAMEFLSACSGGPDMDLRMHTARIASMQAALSEFVEGMAHNRIRAGSKVDAEF